MSWWDTRELPHFLITKTGVFPFDNAFTRHLQSQLITVQSHHTTDEDRTLYLGHILIKRNTEFARGVELKRHQPPTFIVLNKIVSAPPCLQSWLNHTRYEHRLLIQRSHRGHRVRGHGHDSRKTERKRAERRCSLHTVWPDRICRRSYQSLQDSNFMFEVCLSLKFIILDLHRFVDQIITGNL